MKTLERRLQRLEATARLDQPNCQRELEEFGRAAEEHIQALRDYLGETSERAPISCRSESERTHLANEWIRYYLLSLRHYAREQGRHLSHEVQLPPTLAFAGVAQREP